jgi:Acyltransferase family
MITPDAVVAPATERRGELDLLRALVVMVGLILLHSAMVFAPADWFVENRSTSVWFAVFILWGALWGMPLLFVVAGMGVQYSLRTRSAAAFVRERLARLLVPFLFGLAVLVPPMFYLGAQDDSWFHDSYGAFLLRFFAPGPILGALPGLYEWDSGGVVMDLSHLWFLYALLLWSLLLLPLFTFLRTAAGARLAGRLVALLARPGGVLLMALPIAVLEALLRTEENTGGWNRTVYAVLLLYGFLLAADRRLQAALRRQRHLALALGTAASAVLFLWIPTLDAAGIDMFTGPGPAVGWRALKGLAGWLLVAAILGYAGAVMARRGARGGATAAAPAGTRPGQERTWPTRVSGYANQAVLPFYVLHEPVIVGIAYMVVGWHLGIIAGYLTIAVASFLTTLALYEFGVRRTRLTRFLFGMKPPRDREPAGAGGRTAGDLRVTGGLRLDEARDVLASGQALLEEVGRSGSTGAESTARRRCSFPTA